MGPIVQVVLAVVVLLGGLALSCAIARHAAADERVSAAWGVLGPAGWIVAAMRGAHVRQGDLLAVCRRLLAENCVVSASVARGPGAERREARPGVAPSARSSHRGEDVCPRCGEDALRSDGGSPRCDACGFFSAPMSHDGGLNA